jgi:hypothetical protein
MRGVRELSCVVAGVASLVACAAACSSFSSPDVTDPGPGAGVEAGADAAGGRRYCAQHTTATLCSDFDGTELFAGWTPEFDEDGTIDTSDTFFLSAPRSFVATAGSLGPARLGVDVPKDAKRVRVAFDIKLGAFTPSAVDDVSIGEILCSNQGGPYDGVFLLLRGPSKVLTALSNKSATTTAFAQPLGEWTRIVIDGRFDPAPGSVEITIGGAKQPAIPLLTPCANYDSFRVIVGLSVALAPNLDTATAYYDNIVYEKNPTSP